MSKSPPPRWHILPFAGKKQEQSEWCWAAVAASVADYYGNPFKQCVIANAELGRSDCCGAGGPKACNVYGYLMSSLYRVGHFARWCARTSVAKPPPMDDDIRREINGKHPLCLRVQWNGGGAHFMTITGYIDDDPRPDGSVPIDRIGLADPTFNTVADIDYFDFPATYLGGGRWTDTYFTAP